MAKPTIRSLILEERNVGGALQLLRKRMTELSIVESMDSLEEMEADYRLMRESVLRGMRDPNGEKVYDSMLRRVYRLYNTVRLVSICRKRIPFIRCRNVADKFDLQEDSIAKTLEEYVQETAMASLQIDNSESVSLARVNAMHQRYMDDLFCCLLVDGQWSSNRAEFFQKMLVSPMIDQNDASLIVSAITIGMLNVFDVNKWLTLVAVCETAQTEDVRQRALVGMALTLPNGEAMLFPEIMEALQKLCSSQKVCAELHELQIQLLMCMQTEEDNAEIQRDIMPTLIKNSSLKIERSGIVESDDDALGDILNTEDSERKIAEMEEKMNKMMDMKNAGSDIYFGGFSHMKRFSFFYQLSNWFAPFSLQHPDVASVVNGDSGELIRKTIVNGPFCDSDRYSFVFALSAVAAKLPDNMREMMMSGKGIVDGGQHEVDDSSSTYIRRMYLQDLYRFFKLHPERKDFFNPFEATNDNSLFVCNDVFDGCMDDAIVGVARYLYKRRKYGDVVSVLRGCEKSNEATYICALANARLGNSEAAYEQFLSLYKEGFNAQKSLKGVGDALSSMKRYDEAVEYYAKLVELVPDNRMAILSRSLALINIGRAKEGMTELFRLDYENDKDVVVKRLIAWGYLMDGKPQEAEHVYGQILQIKDVVIATDWLNLGYAKWLLAKNEEAVECFKSYLKGTAASDFRAKLNSEFDNDRRMLAANNVKHFEVSLMLDIVCNDGI